MKAYYLNINDIYVDIVRSDNLRYLKTLKSNSVGVCVTDPPYEIAFMHSAKHKWDKNSRAHTVELWREIFRVLKPGAFVLSFAATRTYDLLCASLRKAGFIKKDMFVWCYASGMPKGVNVSKAIDKHLGAKRKKVKQYNIKNPPNLVGGANKGSDRPWRQRALEKGYHEVDDNNPVTKEAKQWDGYFSGIKPAIEPIAVFQKPISESTIVKNILKWNVGAYNVDACRIKANEKDIKAAKVPQPKFNSKNGKVYNMKTGEGRNGQTFDLSKGRFPSNVYLEDHEEIKSLFPYTKSGAVKTTMKRKKSNQIYGLGLSKVGNPITLQDIEANEGSASRFFFQAKANKQDRNGGKHITVKPIKLMRELVRLVTPNGETVLDPFSGTGTTGMAAYLEGFDSIMIEQSKEYVEDIKNRFRPHMR